MLLYGERNANVPHFLHAIPEGENALVRTLLNLNAAFYVERIAHSVEIFAVPHISNIDLK